MPTALAALAVLVATSLAFLESLTDESFVTNPKLSDPFAVPARPADH